MALLEDGSLARRTVCRETSRAAKRFRFMDKPLVNLTTEHRPGANKRAELISVLFVCGNIGLAVPVLGIGLVSTAITPKMADLFFAGVIALLSVAGLVFGMMNKKT